MANTTVNMQIC